MVASDERKILIFTNGDLKLELPVDKTPLNPVTIPIRERKHSNNLSTPLSPTDSGTTVRKRQISLTQAMNRHMPVLVDETCPEQIIAYSEGELFIN